MAEFSNFILRMIKASLSILLSALVLMQGLNLHLSDILELSALLEHIEHHQSSYGDDLSSFLDKHYGAKKTEHDKEEHQNGGNHEKLPFKDRACHSPGNTMIVLAVSPIRKLISDGILPRPSYHYQESYSFLDHTDIFQPPRVF